MGQAGNSLMCDLILMANIPTVSIFEGSVCGRVLNCETEVEFFPLRRGR